MAANVERKRLSSVLSEKRLIDSAATLCIICDLLENYLTEEGFMSQTEVVSLKNRMKQGITMQALISQNISTEDSVAVKVAKIIEEAIQSRKFILATERPGANDMLLYDGFFDDSYYYFLPNNLFETVKKYYSAGNVFLPFDLEQMNHLLYDEGILVVSSNGNRKKTYYARLNLGDGKKRNFIKINRQKLSEICED